ncbi:MAG: SH3 domain-containing protein, partial [Clostridiales bacterium]|nr:SH3 domain-containing protein [Clostridiales bacterium]
MEPSQASKKGRKHRVMGSVLSVICMAAILASTLPATPAFAAEEPLSVSETARASAVATTTDRLNLRAGAGSGYEVLTVLELGAQVTILDDSNAEWVKVRTSSGQEGYCSRQYLNMGAAAVSDTLKLDTKSYTNTTGSTYRFLARVTAGDDGTAPTVSSSNTSVVTVTYAGKKEGQGYLYDIKLVGSGSATITVKAHGETATLPVTVTGGSSGGSSSNASLSLDTKSYSNGPGNSYRFLAKVSGGSGSAPTVSSSNTSVATVSYAGKDSRGYLYDIKTVGPGSATVTVSVDGK